MKPVVIILLIGSIVSNAQERPKGPQLSLPNKWYAVDDGFDWMRPNDATFQRAIDEGYANRSVHYAKIDTFVGTDQVSRIVIQPPLACAFELSQYDGKRLKEKPKREAMASFCYGALRVTVIRLSVSARGTWEMVMDVGKLRVRPDAAERDDSPDIVKVGGKVFFKFTDMYSFGGYDTWKGMGILTWSDENSVQHRYPIDFSIFEKDELAHRPKN
jgi:hypothetical protein